MSAAARLGERVIWLARKMSMPSPPSAATHLRAAILPAHFLQIRIRRMPMLHVNHQPRIMLHAGVASLQPVVEPAHRLIAPFDARPKSGSLGQEWFHGPTIALIGAFDFISMSGTLSR